jgi:small subunit ribosomal protein S2
MPVPLQSTNPAGGCAQLNKKVSCSASTDNNRGGKEPERRKADGIMAISVKDLLEAGCHFGHQTKRWNPKMKDYVYGAKNGISIIDLTKTIRQIGDACNFLQREVMKGSRILFVGTKRQAQQVVRNAAEETEMFFMSERWMGGTLTNIETIRKSVKKMREIDDIVNNEESSNLKKKEIVRLERQGVKLHRNLDGIADMKRLPDVVVVVDVCHDATAVKEAQKLNIPIIAIVDTNGNPENIAYPVAANDDAVKSIKIIMDTFVAAINDALGLYKVKVAEDKAKADAERAEKKGADDKAKSSDERPARRPSRRPAGARKEGAAADGEKKAAPRRRTASKEVKDLSELKKSDVKPEEK